MKLSDHHSGRRLLSMQAHSLMIDRIAPQIQEDWLTSSRDDCHEDLRLALFSVNLQLWALELTTEVESVDLDDPTLFKTTLKDLQKYARTQKPAPPEESDRLKVQLAALGSYTFNTPTDGENMTEELYYGVLEFAMIRNNVRWSVPRGEGSVLSRAGLNALEVATYHTIFPDLTMHMLEARVAPPPLQGPGGAPDGGTPDGGTPDGGTPVIEGLQEYLLEKCETWATDTAVNETTDMIWSVMTSVYDLEIYSRGSMPKTVSVSLRPSAEVAQDLEAEDYVPRHVQRYGPKHDGKLHLRE